jgi:hypothetical protein
MGIVRVKTLEPVNYGGRIFEPDAQSYFGKCIAGNRLGLMNYD